MSDGIDFPPANESPFTDPNGRIWDWTATKWVMRPQNVFTDVPIDSVPYVRRDQTWVAGVVNDPGAFGVLYVRRDGAWYEVTDVGSGITDAPSDGTLYGRKDAAWSNILIADIPEFQTALDLKSDIDHTHFLADISDSGAMASQNDAPDASEYVRVNGAWVPNTPADGIIFNDGITIVNPQDTDDGTLIFVQTAINILNINAHIVGPATDVTCNIHFGPDRSVPGTTIFNTDISITSESGEAFSPDVTAIPINSWIWLDITSVTNSPTMVHLTINYSQG